MDATNTGGGLANDGVQNVEGGASTAGQRPILERTEPSLAAVLIGKLTLDRVRDFLRITGTGILYALSALSILYGLAQIIGPVLATSGNLGETLPCFGALQGYELSVFGVLLLIVLWRRTTRDTTMLMVLVALFVGASGITLATIANDGPEIAVIIGLVCMALALAKLWLLRTKVGMASSRLFAWGLAVLVIWNFLISAYMALTLHREWPGSEELRLVWLGGWHVVIAAALLFFLSALACHTEGARRTGEGTPFLRSTAMAWVFAFVLTAGAVVHQYALTYIFDLPLVTGDFLPIVILGMLVFLEVLRGYGWHTMKEISVLLALPPFVLVLPVIGKHAFLASPQWGLGTLVQPWAALAMAGLLLLVIAIRRKDAILAGIALLYAPFSVLLVGAMPEYTVRTLNFWAFGVTLVVVLFALAVLFRSVKLAAVAVTLFAVGMMTSGRVNAIAQPVLATRLDIFAAVLGAGIVSLYLAFPRHVHLTAGMLGAAVLAFAAIHGQPEALTYPWLMLALGLAALGGLALWRVRDFVTSGILAVPLLWRGVLSLGDVTGWHYIALSFVLLGAGAFFSLRSRHPHGE